MVYIRSASSISVQPPGSPMKAVSFPAPVVEPDYKLLINPGMMRRMSPILKYGVAAGVDCLQKAGVATPTAVITGTGLGCLRDTQKFMETFLTTKEESLPPTAFIQSTHNTLSGQIALLTKCYGYNMAFVQNSLSFEYALLDGMMLAEGGADNILVGGADEKIPFLEEAAAKLGLPQEKINELSEGAAFFLLSNTGQDAIAKITDIHCEASTQIDVQQSTKSFLAKNGLGANNIDFLVYGDNTFGDNYPVESIYNGVKLNFTDYTGYYFTNSAVALHLCLQALQGNTPEGVVLKSAPKTILLLNRYQNKSLGLILIQTP